MKYLNLIFTSGEWKFYHRREFIKAIGKNFHPWSYTVAIQYPVSLILNIFFKFKERMLPFLKGEDKPKEISENLVLFTPLVFFHYKFWAKSKFFAFIDSYLLNIQIKKFIKKRYKISKIIIWTYVPQHIDLLKFIKYDYIIYDMYDDNERNYDGTINLKLEKLNKRLVSSSTLVLCNAHSVINKISHYSNNAIFVPSAVNLDFYRGEEYAKTLLNNESSKIIGYLGNIRNWIDFELIKEILETFKTCKLALVGGVDKNAVEEMKFLHKYENLIHIDHVQQQQTPNYIKKFSIGIIPFKINDFTKSVLPYKFYEYIAVKIPIVSTALPELRKYKDICGYSETNSDFIKNIEYYLSNENKIDINKYEEIILQNTWSNRTKKIENELRNRNVFHKLDVQF